MSESWPRAMLLAYDAHKKSGGKRQRVHGYRLGDAGWAYSTGRALKPHHRPPPPPEPVVMTEQLFVHLSETLPRCAQRAFSAHGGGSKLAIGERSLALAMAAYAGQGIYHCPPPAPAIGSHYHLKTVKRRKWPL